MNGFFDRISIRPLVPSSVHLTSQRIHGIAEILGTSVQGAHSAAILPSKFAQFLTSLHAVFRKDTGCTEKIIHLLEAFLAALHGTLVITLLFMKENCDEQDPVLCTLLKIINSLYLGILLTGWGASEASAALHSYYNSGTHLRDEGQQCLPSDFNAEAGTQWESFVIDIEAQNNLEQHEENNSPLSLTGSV